MLGLRKRDRTIFSLVGLGLVLLLLGFGYASASEVFVPVSFECHGHDHGKADAAYCGCQIQLPAHRCIHSTTTLDIAEASPPERRFEAIERVNLDVAFSSDTPTFKHYHLRAPPSSLS